MQRVRSVIGWFRRQPVWVVDTPLALALGYADNAVVVRLSSVEVIGPMRVSPAIAVILVLAGTLPLAARRLAPVPVMAVTGVIAVCTAVLLIPTTALGLMVAIYTVAAHCSRRTALVASGAVLVAVVTTLVASGVPHFSVADAVVVAAVTLLGDRTRVARERAVALRAQADSLARAAVAAERARIARELHDITAHGVAVIAVQAAGARRVLAADPDRAAEALREIEDTARGGLVELRQAVTLLREDDDPDAWPQLDSLLTRFRDAGLRIDAELPDPAPRLSPAVGLAVYRVVQEALTNTLRHAGRTSARVTIALRHHRPLPRRGARGGGRRRPAGRSAATHRAARTRTDRAARAGAVAGRAAVRARRRGRVPRRSPDPRAMTLRVLIADDQRLVRTGLSMILESEPGIEVVGEAEDGAAAVTMARAIRPDVVLMDVRMPGTDGIAATAQLAAADDPVKVLILTTFDADELVHAALRAGASGFLLKDAPAPELVNAVRVIADGQAMLAPTVTRRLLASFVRHPPAQTADLSALTAREQEVLLLVAEGLSNAEIASRLVLGETTVKTHVGRVLAKLGLRDRVQAVVLAYETGLVTPRR